VAPRVVKALEKMEYRWLEEFPNLPKKSGLPAKRLRARIRLMDLIVRLTN